VNTRIKKILALPLPGNRGDNFPVGNNKPVGNFLRRSELVCGKMKLMAGWKTIMDIRAGSSSSYCQKCQRWMKMGFMFLSPQAAGYQRREKG